MQLTNKAKKKWFKENICSFELYYYDCIRNTRLVEFDYFEGLHKCQNKSDLYTALLKRTAIDISKLTDWQIFFKYKKFRMIKNVNEKYVFKFSYDRI